MKAAVNTIKMLVLFLATLYAGEVRSQCAANFAYTVGPNGSVTFMSTSSTSSLGTTLYTWNFGTSTYSNTGSSGVNPPPYTYTANGVYTVTLSIFQATPSSCNTSTSQTFTINTICGVNASLTASQGAAGLVNFTNLSTNTVASTSYTWNFGDGTPTSSVTSPAHTYTANGTYTVILQASNSSTINCVSTYTLVITVSSICTLAASFTYAPGPNGTINFINLTTPTTGVTYTWSLGGAGFSFSPNPVASYTANGVYTVSLTAVSSSPYCTSTTTSTISVNNIGSCSLTPNFTYTQGSNGVVNFSNTSTGTVATSSYTWNFGDNTAISTQTSPVHTYSANGTYIATLAVQSNTVPVCSGTKTLIIVVNSYCTLAANFTYSVNGGNVQFTNLTSTSSAVSYTWSFGNSNTSNSVNPSVTYSANATYTVVLTAQSFTPFCTSTASQAIVISGIVPICTVNAAFSHTVGSSGQVSFSNLSTGTSTTTTYSWNFGDGWTSVNMNPGHTYLTGGTYYVKLKTSNSASCVDSVIQAINITGILCVANSGFSLVPTGTPQYWSAIPSYPWNVSTAMWSWGDNSTLTNSLYCSHQYSVSGSYNICLSVTVSCGATSSTCATYSVYRPPGTSSIIYVNILEPAPVSEILGIAGTEATITELSVFPNPNDGLFSVRVDGAASEAMKVEVLDLVGKKVFEEYYEAGNSAFEGRLDLRGEAGGIYFVRISAGQRSCTKKIIISR